MNSAFQTIPVQSGMEKLEELVTVQPTLLRSFAVQGIEFKIPVSAVQSRPCPPVLQSLNEHPRAVTELSPELSLSEAVADWVPRVAASLVPASRRSLSATIAWRRYTASVL
jgi:hypothetical protein